MRKAAKAKEKEQHCVISVHKRTIAQSSLPRPEKTFPRPQAEYMKNRRLKFGAADSECGSPLPPQKAVQIGLALYISPMASRRRRTPETGKAVPRHRKPGICGLLAQLVEQRTVNPQVTGSKPVQPSITAAGKLLYQKRRRETTRKNRDHGGGNRLTKRRRNNYGKNRHKSH